MAAPPLDSHCDGPVTYPGDIKTHIKSSKRRSGLTLTMTTSLGLTENKTVPGKVVTTRTEDGHKQNTETSVKI
jgi:hypothetical protein